jgi:uncharacterized RDD family membrane protein YckC
MTLQPSGWRAPEPENGPAPGIAFGGPGERLVAYIVDLIIIGVAVVAIVILGGIMTFVLPVVGILSLIVGIVVVPLIYFPYYWSSTGQTPGMKMMGIKVVRDRDGGPVTSGQAILRLLGYWVSGFVFYLGYIWIFVDKRKRGWHDLIAGTVVVEAARSASRAIDPA